MTLLTSLTKIRNHIKEKTQPRSEGLLIPIILSTKKTFFRDTVITRKHTVTDADIVNFANVSGDNFYAHVDATSLDGTIFEQNVAHGYWVLSKAAGLFVDGKKGPVLLNYGLDECRFTKPVYPGMTLGVKFTAKEKTSQEKKTFEEGEEIPKGADIKKGIVKFLVDVYDETGETVALATILTMIKFKNQD